MRPRRLRRREGGKLGGPPPSRLGGPGECHKLPQRDPGQSSSRNRFWCILSLTLKEPIWRQDMWYLVILHAQKMTEKYEILGLETDSKATSQHNMYFSWILQVQFLPYCNAQYTPPTLTRLSCQVKWRRRCVHNSHLVGDSLDKFEQMCQQRSRVASCWRCEYIVSSCDPVYNFLCCWAIKVGDKWRHNDVIVEKDINIDQNSCSQPAMFSFQIVDGSVGSRRELVATCVHTADANATRRRCGVYWP